MPRRSRSSSARPRRRQRPPNRSRSIEPGASVEIAIHRARGKRRDGERRGNQREEHSLYKCRSKFLGRLRSSQQRGIPSRRLPRARWIARQIGAVPVPNARDSSAAATPPVERPIEVVVSGRGFPAAPSRPGPRPRWGAIGARCQRFSEASDFRSWAKMLFAWVWRSVETNFTFTASLPGHTVSSQFMPALPWPV